MARVGYSPLQEIKLTAEDAKNAEKCIFATDENQMHTDKCFYYN